MSGQRPGRSGQRPGPSSYGSEPLTFGRENYKKWPWASFLIVALCIGTIFFIAGSPQTIANAGGIHLALSVGFLVLGSALLIPSFIFIIILIWIFIATNTGCFLPQRIRKLMQIAKGKSPSLEGEKNMVGTEERNLGGNSKISPTAGPNTKRAFGTSSPQPRPPMHGYSNPAMEDTLESTEEELDFSREELVLNINDYNRSRNGTPNYSPYNSINRYSPVTHNYSHPRSVQSKGDAGSGEWGEEIVPMDDASVWTTNTTSSDVKSFGGRHRPTEIITADVTGQQRDASPSNRSYRGWVDFDGDTDYRTQRFEGPVLNGPVHQTTQFKNQGKRSKHRGRKECKSTLLSLSESYVTHLQSPSSSPRSQRGARGSRASSPQTIYIVNPQRQPVRDTVI